MATITKYGDRFYSMERLRCAGHRDKDGRMLAGIDALIFAFRKADDPPGLNVDPVDILLVLIEEYGSTPAGRHLRAAKAALAGEPSEDETQVIRRKPGPKAKQKIAMLEHEPVPA